VHRRGKRPLEERLTQGVVLPGSHSGGETVTSAKEGGIARGTFVGPLRVLTF